MNILERYLRGEINCEILNIDGRGKGGCQI